MTLRDLKELAGLERLTEKERERLQTLRDSLDLKAQVISDMPRGGGARDRIGEGVPRLVDEARKLEENVREYERRISEAREYIEGINDPRMKLIVKMRFLDGASWQDVADYLGGRETEYSVKHACYRYVEGRDPGTVKGQIGLFE